MRYIFQFPDIGEGISEGKIVEWHVHKGQEIDSGDSLVTMETDKVVTDLPSPKAGTIAAVFGKEGDTVEVGDPLVELDIPGVDGEAGQKEAEEKPKGKTRDHIPQEDFGVVGSLEVAGDGAFLPASSEGIQPEAVDKGKTAKKVLATPVARAVAKDLGVDINRVKGTGPAGRVTKKDIQNYYDKLTSELPGPKQKAPSPATAAKHAELEEEHIPLSPIRKTIARNMLISKQKAPHMTVFDEVEISEVKELRDRYREGYQDEGIKLTYLPFVIKALTVSLTRHITLNSRLDLERELIIRKNYFNIGIAVDTDEGLVVPVIRDANRLSVKEIAQQVQHYVEKAHARTLSIEEIRGGTFTVTNFGAIGGRFAVPVINYPEAGILGVGRIKEKPYIKDGTIAIGTFLPLSLAVDHRIVDGGEATRFLNDIMRFLNEPSSILME